MPLTRNGSSKRNSTSIGIVAGFVRRHWRAYVAAALMLVGIAVLTVWVPRQVGRIVDALVAGNLTGGAMWRELGTLVAMGVAIYLLRVGWRLQLFRGRLPARRGAAHPAVRS